MADGIGIRPYPDLSDAPVVSKHPYPQPSPQEWDCGCITATWITDRDAMTEGEDPFEMRLAHRCDGTDCQLPTEVVTCSR